MAAREGDGAGRALDVLMLCYEFPPVGGGGARVVAGLARELARRGHRVDVLTMRWPGRRGGDRVPGVGLIEVPALRRGVVSTSVWELLLYLPPLMVTAAARFLRRRYDVCHVHFMLPDGIAAWGLRRVFGRHFVITAHGSDVPGYNPERFVLMHRMLRPVWRRIARSADIIICPSPTLERLVQGEAQGARTTVIPNGFDETRFDSARERLPRILVVSRLFRRKGIHTVIEAFLGLATQYELHVVGDGPEMAAVSALAARRPGIVVHGWIDNADPRLRELYETASVFALMSEAENFPVCLLEAMAAGLAIVTTAGTGCADVVGDAAVLVAPGDVDGVRRALARLTNDPAAARRLGRAARRHLEQHFTWRRVADEHVRLYRGMGSGAPPGRRLARQGNAGSPADTLDATLWPELEGAAPERAA